MRAAQPSTLHIEGAIDGEGGSFRSLAGLLERMDRSRFEPVALFCRPCEAATRLREQGLDVYVLPKPPLRPLAAGRAAFYSELARATLECAGVIRSLEQGRGSPFALVHTNDQLITNAGWISAARMLRRAIVCHERQHGDFRAVHRALASGISAHVRISTSVDRHCREHGIWARRNALIYNGLTIPSSADRAAAKRRGARALADLGVGSEASVLLYAGTVAPWKGADMAVRAFAALRPEAGRPEPILVLAGAASADAPTWPAEVKRLSQELGVAGRLKWVGRRSDVTDWMCAADVVLHAAVRPEPFGRVPLEAMAWGAPVVASETGGVAEVLGAEHPGLVPAGRPAAMARAVEKVLAGECATLAAAEAGVARAAARFSIEAHVREMEEVFDGAAGQHGGRREQRSASVRSTG